MAGIRYAVLFYFSVLYKVSVSLVVLLISLIYEQWLVSAIILVSTGMVLMAKHFIIAIEAICAFVESRHNEKIGFIKDIAAAADIVIAILSALMIHGW